MSTKHKPLSAAAKAALVALALGLGLPGTGGAQAGFGDTTRAPRCKVELDLMAVVYNARAPERSFAMVSSGRGPGWMIGMGSYVAGRPVLAMLPRALWLGPEESLCWIPLSHDGKQQVTPKKTSKRGKRKRKR